ncbi:unnamed protein product [Rotaria sp. Silwood2]|nr:unnamed protein product [Rotaria sp. Silwood2]
MEGSDKSIRLADSSSNTNIHSGSTIVDSDFTYTPIPDPLAVYVPVASLTKPVVRSILFAALKYETRDWNHSRRTLLAFLLALNKKLEEVKQGTNTGQKIQERIIRQVDDIRQWFVYEDDSGNLVEPNWDELRATYQKMTVDKVDDTWTYYGGHKTKPYYELIISVVSCHIQSGVQLPEISELGTGQAHNYFMSDFIILVPQLLVMFIGRLQLLIQTQTIIHRAIIFFIHIIVFVSGVFVLIMAIVSLDDRRHIHDIGAIGTFGFISLYCLLHTIIIIYLFMHRSKASEHSNYILLLWFIGCTIILITCSIIWVITFASIPEYIATGTPFLYFLGFVPQFWKKRNK